MEYSELQMLQQENTQTLQLFTEQVAFNYITTTDTTKEGKYPT